MAPLLAASVSARKRSDRSQDAITSARMLALVIARPLDDRRLSGQQMDRRPVEDVVGRRSPRLAFRKAGSVGEHRPSCGNHESEPSSFVYLSSP